MAQFSIENRLRAITMNLSEVNLMSNKKENHHSSAKHDQSAKLGKSLCNGSINMSLNCSTNSQSVLAKTPKRTETSFSNNKTPKMTQGPTLGKPNSWKSPAVGGGACRKAQNILGDRMVPSRSTTDFEAAHHKMTSEESSGDRVLSYQTVQIPKPQEAYINHQKALYSATASAQKKPSNRFIPNTADRVLDAPAMMNDYYLNLLDWSQTNFISVALDKQVYLWNAASGDIQELMECEGEDNYISSVQFTQDGSYLAIGLNTGSVELWDIQQQRRLRTMAGHAARIGVLAWNEHVLSSGSRSGLIFHHDVRIPQHLVASLEGHTQEVCSLKWSGDHRYLASGGNDNLVHIWEGTTGQTTRNTPVHVFNQHQAAVKGMAWCPWQNRLLATGGGSNDRSIKLWNMNVGECVDTIDTKSQVSGIFWNTEYQEIISAHGFPNHTLQIWKYPTKAKVAELTGHDERILHLAMSPGETAVMSAGADETLRLWNCFQTDPNKKKGTAGRRNEPRSALDAMSNFR
ncbi:cell division cycle protein 20 homolog [Daphnia pulicaria]|uniref:cell division cycle protein 20 homolog n=1 Tax=Daphnia pulicaria TaxID=35523 RepID=UPI001EEA1CA9|nr:cell division cycle protein 20 homolog [Daphnia pulicaria]